MGNFRNNGREWRRQGRPELVNVHDFIDPKLKRAVRYGIYDIANNTGWGSVDTDHDTGRCRPTGRGAALRRRSAGSNPARGTMKCC